MTYEAWRVTYQDSEQAAVDAYLQCQHLTALVRMAQKELRKDYINPDATAVADFIEANMPSND